MTFNDVLQFEPFYKIFILTLDNTNNNNNVAIEHLCVTLPLPLGVANFFSYLVYVSHYCVFHFYRYYAYYHIC